MVERRRNVPPYQVGYKRPPKATQFKPGQSGNPRGRAKGVRNFSTEMEKELSSQVVITENGATKRVSKRVVIAKQMVKKAASGDLKAAALLIFETRPLSGAAIAPPSETLTAIESKVFDNLLLRIRRIEPRDPIDADSDTSPSSTGGGAAVPAPSASTDGSTSTGTPRARRRVSK